MRPTELEFYDRGNVWVRRGTTDRDIVRSLRREYRTLAPFLPGAAVLDLGGHIGGFARWALDSGAQEVTSFEPDDGNAELFVRNCPDARLVRSAVTVDGRPANLYSTGDPASHSIYPTRRRVSLGRVGTVSLAEVFFGGHPMPTVMKVDVEGAELELLSAGVPRSIFVLAVEWHFRNRTWWKAAAAIHEQLQKEMSVLEVSGRMDPGRRNCVVTYGRRDLDQERRPRRSQAVRGRRVPALRRERKRVLR